jgi:hypothetical protein
MLVGLLNTIEGSIVMFSFESLHLSFYDINRCVGYFYSKIKKIPKTDAAPAKPPAINKLTG